jgi:hypothetical protein
MLIKKFWIYNENLKVAALEKKKFAKPNGFLDNLTCIIKWGSKSQIIDVVGDLPIGTN